MKNALILFLGITLLSCNSKPVSTVSPLDYNNQIIGEQSKIMTIILDLGKEGLSVDDIDKVIKDLSAQCKVSIEVISKMEPFEGDNSLRNAALDLFNFYLKSSEGEYTEMVDIIRKGDAITEADMTRLNEINLTLGEREKPFDAKFQGAQKAFAKKHNLMLKKNELQDKIDNL